jgi:hypothetical protein
VYVLLGFEATGKFVVVIFNIISNDFPNFIKSYIIILFGFSSAIAAITSSNLDRSVHDGFSHFFEIAWKMFNFSIGQSTSVLDETSYDLSERTSWVFVLLAAGHNLGVLILMLNLLIGLFSETYAKFASKSHLILRRERLNMMRGFERSMTKEQRQEATHAYAICFDPKHKPVFDNNSDNDTESCCSKLLNKFFCMKMSVEKTQEQNPNYFEMQSFDVNWLHYGSSNMKEKALYMSTKEIDDIINGEDTTLFATSSVSNMKKNIRVVSGRNKNSKRVVVATYKDGMSPLLPPYRKDLPPLHDRAENNNNNTNKINNTNYSNNYNDTNNSYDDNNNSVSASHHYEPYVSRYTQRLRDRPDLIHCSDQVNLDLFVHR